MSDTELVIEPVATKRDIERFIKFPWQVYADYPAWVPPLIMDRRETLDPQKNPFLGHAEAQLFIARRGQRDVGTIAAFVDHRVNETHGELVGCFGFFEVLQDSEAAAALLQTAEEWARARGMQVVRGPLNFSHNNESGLLLDAYDTPPMVITLYNPPYYRDYIEQFGFVKHIDWHAYLIERAALSDDSMTSLHPRLQRALDIFRRRSNVTIRKIDLRHFDEELAHVQYVYNTAWEQRDDFVQMDDAESAHLANSLRPVIDADLVLLAEAEGQVVGAAISLPDLNQVLQRMNGRLLPFGWWHFLRRNAYMNQLRVFAVGVIPAYRRRGIELVFYIEIVRAAIRKGYLRGELSLIAEDNVMMRRSVESIGAHIYKTYRVYEKSI